MNIQDYKLSLNKLMILFMIHKADMPLSNTQLSDFLLENNYTNYFSLQTYINELVDTNLISTSKITSHTLYDLTDIGSETLSFFTDRIPEGLKKNILLYLQENNYNIRSKFEIIATYNSIVTGIFLVNCVAKENGHILVELNIQTSDEKEAITMCETWKSNSHIIYKQLLTTLLDSDNK